MGALQEGNRTIEDGKLLIPRAGMSYWAAAEMVRRGMRSGDDADDRWPTSNLLGSQAHLSPQYPLWRIQRVEILWPCFLRAGLNIFFVPSCSPLDVTVITQHWQLRLLFSLLSLFFPFLVIYWVGIYGIFFDLLLCLCSVWMLCSLFFTSPCNP